MVAVDPLGEATKRKEPNYLSTPDRVLAASRSPPMHQNRSFPDGVRQEGRGGTTCEPLPHKRTARSMRRASPCSIDRREPLMPSIALLGLVKAESAASEQMKKHPAAILTPLTSPAASEISDFTKSRDKSKTCAGAQCEIISSSNALVSTVFLDD